MSYCFAAIFMPESASSASPKKNSFFVKDFFHLVDMEEDEKPAERVVKRNAC
jgi:hypothetical protein